MDDSPEDIRPVRFRSAWTGYNRREVMAYVAETSDETARLRAENEQLRKSLAQCEKDLREFRDRDRLVRGVLVSAQKAIETMKENAEREAKVIVSEAELQAEKILHAAHQNLARLHDDTAELKRQRAQLELRLRSTIETWSRLLEHEAEEDGEPGAEPKVKYLNRQADR